MKQARWIADRRRSATVSRLVGLILIGAVNVSVCAGSRAAQTASAGASIEKAAQRLEAAGQLNAAGDMYTKAAAAYEKEGNAAARVKALGKSAEMYEKYADQLLQGVPAAPAAPAPAQPAAPVEPAVDAPAPPPAQVSTPAKAQTETGAVPLPLERSLIVHPNAKGALAVSNTKGRPINGLKLSRHDREIYNPGIVVTRSGGIHVAFVEMHAQTYKYAVYHRSSSDGGKTWSDAKNLSEVLPDYAVGTCNIAADSAGRVYVIWCTGMQPQFPSSGFEPHGNQAAISLVYRVLEDGAWSSKAIAINPPATYQYQDEGAVSHFVATDGAGRVHVVWNQFPIKYQKFKHNAPMGRGDVWESVLDGRNAGQPREVFQSPFTPGDFMGPVSDDFDTINGYSDSSGADHFIAKVTNYTVHDTANRINLIENGKQTPAIELPGETFRTWHYPPTLLLDAQGRKHIIAQYESGEQPNVRDYLVGSDTEPTIIRAAKEVKGKLIGSQAYQGPHGRMIVLMEMNDTGEKTDDELYVSTSTGGKWSAPVNVTNNTGRLQFHSTNTGSESSVAMESYWYPGPAAATYDNSGHLLLLYVSNKMSLFGSSAFGVTLSSGSSSTPNLLFLHF
jgi:hypothetical protein